MRVFIQSFILLVLSVANVLAQDIYEQQGYLRNPIPVSNGIVFTDNYHSSIYLSSSNHIEKLFSFPGCGNYFTSNKNASQIGLKLIDNDLMQTPVVFSLESRSFQSLHKPVKQCGQVSFADDGSIGFTVDNRLLIQGANGKTREVDLGTYANIAPISPDATMAAFNDDKDQLYIINILTGKRTQVSPEGVACFLPQWSPDGLHLQFSSLHGNLYIYNIGSGKITSLGSGSSPRWMNDRELVFSNVTVEDMRLIGSELAIADVNGTIRMITDSKDIAETDAWIDKDGTILFTGLTDRNIYTAQLGSVLSGIENRKVVATAAFAIQPNAPVGTNHIQKAMEVPYVNQVYDTPDWFNGSTACGPTTSIMALAYFNVLPKWDGTCSWPSYHVNSWGRYICEKYAFRQMYYIQSANDPNEKPGYGGFGFMWGSGSPHSRMSSYYFNHGLTSSTSDNPSIQSIKNELLEGNPVSFCVGLTTSGHIVLVHGTGTSAYSLVVNDPYGDKNKPGYPNYLGKNATYDWPGYNNGFQNFKTAYWISTSKATPLAVVDTIVDDLQFNRGFVMNNASPATMYTWRDFNTGYNNHCWVAYSKASGMDTCFAEWRLPITRNGSYEVAAYIPGSTSKDSRYKITHANGSNNVAINQTENINKWAVLGSFYFLKGSTAVVRLGDGSSEAGRNVVFDAVRWTYTGDPNGMDDDRMSPLSFSLEQNHPNPFNPETNIKFTLPEAGNIRLVVYDVLGREVQVLADGFSDAGEHSIRFNANGMSSGVYIYSLSHSGTVLNRKMTLLR